MKTLPLVRLIVPSLVLAIAGFAVQTAGAQDAAAPTTCKDGTTSSATGRGACSGHGGVQKATSSGSTGTASAPAATPPASSVPPAGATAKCKDGTYSKSTHHSGTCSKHGGVDQWLDGSK
jgi:hypothetical protein